MSMVMMLMTTMIMTITYFTNNFNEKHCAVFGVKLFRPLGDLSDQETNVPMLQIPNLSHNQDSDHIIWKP